MCRDRRRAHAAAPSTLLDAIGGRRRLGAGVRETGETTRIAYLTQEAPTVAGGATMLSHLRRAAPYAGPARRPPGRRAAAAASASRGCAAARVGAGGRACPDQGGARRGQT